ncbi:MAG: RtcB family protein [Saprospiraceae bacterium]|nr:RtcB family protein [Saprospiraceae bacterium]
MGSKISGKDLIKLGFPQNNSINIALGYINRYKKREKKESVLAQAKDVLLQPDTYMGDPTWGKIAESLVKPVELKMHRLKTERVPFQIYGENEIEDAAKYQLYESLKLPVAVKGALMPDGHAGYGLPIGGVLATDNAVIPYGVGVDIGCRMSLSIFDLPGTYVNGREDELKNILQDHTKFGMTETHKIKADHAVLDRKEFREIPLLKGMIDKAYKQLGTSGGGNHFVEFGIADIDQTLPEWKLKPGSYFAVLSHSGSRGLGANIAKHYTTLAMKQCPLPRQVQHLAWLDLNTRWYGILVGDESSRGTMLRLVTKTYIDGLAKHWVNVFWSIFPIAITLAWRETIDGKECIVHRKGATPASRGVAGIIPGSMTAPGYIVVGKGDENSIQSASMVQEDCFQDPMQKSVYSMRSKTTQRCGCDFNRW